MFSNRKYVINLLLKMEFLLNNITLWRVQGLKDEVYRQLIAAKRKYFPVRVVLIWWCYPTTEHLMRRSWLGEGVSERRRATPADRCLIFTRPTLDSFLLDRTCLFNIQLNQNSTQLKTLFHYICLPSYFLRRKKISLYSHYAWLQIRNMNL